VSTVIVELLAWWIAMLLLIGSSAFFSASEAALFYLQGPERRAMAAGTRAQRVAAALLDDPDRLLSAVLFWNLMVNVTYFALAAIVGLQLRAWLPRSGVIAYSCGSLLILIFFSEMLPKSLAVLRAPAVAALVSIPLAAAVRAVDWLMPVLRMANLLSRRLVWPGFQPEPYLEISDLERAIALSTSDAQLREQEQVVLQNLVSLSEVRVDEWMRPRSRLATFPPPVRVADLGGQVTPGGYLLVTEPESDEIAAAVHLAELYDVSLERLERYADPVVYVPWCTTVADALETLRTRDLTAAAVVNELGDTIGILTVEDILDAIFTSRGGLLDREPIQPCGPGVWRVMGMTNLSRLAEYFGVELPETRSLTLAGALQEALQRIPEPGDEGSWGPFRFHVREATPENLLAVELSRDVAEEETP